MSTSRPPPQPRPCVWCGHDTFAEGTLWVLRAITSTMPDRINEFAKHECHGLTCMSCGRVDLFVKDPNSLFQSATKTEADHLGPMRTVRAAQGYRG